jgi:uncharacterized DUF497 family protein
VRTDLPTGPADAPRRGSVAAVAGPTFEWDAAKAAANLLQHGVSFEDAATVFQDPLAKIHDDPDHSASERRDIIVGHSIQGQLLLVSFTNRGSKLRLISARPVTSHERHDYEEAK